MKKGVIVTIVLIAAAGGAFYAYSSGRLDRVLPEKYLPENILPEQILLKQQSSSGGLVSSDSSNAVYVSSVSSLAEIGTGDGIIQRYTGIVQPQQTRKITLDGTRSVKECYVEEGQEVKSGTKLFTYDNSDSENKLETAEIELERQKITIETSEKQLEELKKQYQKEQTTENELAVLEADNSLKQAKLELKSKQKEIDNLKKLIADADVYCDFEGIIQKINSSLGTAGSDSQNSMSYSSYSAFAGDSSDSDAYITILDLGTYRIQGSINEQNVNDIALEDRMIAYSRVDSSQHWVGTVSEIKGQDDSSNSDSSNMYNSSGSSGTSDMSFYVSLDNADGLMLGQHVYLEKDMGQLEQKQGIWLDSYYFGTEADGTVYVWLANDKNQLEKHPVTIGEKDEKLQKWQVSGGLLADDYIAMPDANLQEGLPVVYNSQETGVTEGYETEEDLEDVAVGGPIDDSMEIYNADTENMGGDAEYSMADNLDAGIDVYDEGAQSGSWDDSGNSDSGIATVNSGLSDDTIDLSSLAGKLGGNKSAAATVEGDEDMEVGVTGETAQLSDNSSSGTAPDADSDSADSKYMVVGEDGEVYYDADAAAADAAASAGSDADD